MWVCLIVMRKKIVFKNKKNSFLNLLSLKGLNMHFMYNERFLKLFLIFDIVLFKMFYEN